MAAVNNSWSIVYDNERRLTFICIIKWGIILADRLSGIFNQFFVIFIVHGCDGEFTACIIVCGGIGRHRIWQLSRDMVEENPSSHCSLPSGSTMSHIEMMPTWSWSRATYRSSFWPSLRVMNFVQNELRYSSSCSSSVKPHEEHREHGMTVGCQAAEPDSLAWKQGSASWKQKQEELYTFSSASSNVSWLVGAGRSSITGTKHEVNTYTYIWLYDGTTLWFTQVGPWLVKWQLSWVSLTF